MKILAIDTSSFPASAAVLDNDLVVGEYVIRNKRKHSQNIMVMVERLFDDLGMDISEMDAFAVTVGPGSFTGLRIGIASVRAFADVLNKPAAGVNTLKALAYNFCGSSEIIIPMLDARRDEVFTAAYTFVNGECEEIMAPCVMTIEEICSVFTDGRVIFTGDGAIVHRAEIEQLSRNGEFASPNMGEVRASALAVCANDMAKQGELVDCLGLTPLYLRKSQAERELEIKNKKGETT